MNRRRWIEAVVRRARATRLVWQAGAAHMKLLSGPESASDVGPCEPVPNLAPTPRLAVPRAYIDHAKPGASVNPELLEVAGWAMGTVGPAARVELTIDGQPAGRARLGMARNDVAAATMRPTAAFSGFEAFLDLRRLPHLAHDDELELGGEAFGMDGERIPLSPVRVAVATPDTGEPLKPESIGPPRLGRRSARKSSSRLRLLVPTHRLDWGGGQLFLVELLRQLAAQRRVSGLVLSELDGPLAPLLESFGFEVHVTSYPTGSPRAYECRLRELTAFVADRDYDAALVNTLGSFPGAEVAQRVGLPTVWAVHESYTLPGFWAALGGPSVVHPAVRARAERTLRAADALVFEADATRILFERELPGVTCLTRRYGVDVDALDRWHADFDRTAERERHGIPADALLLLCMATIEPRKSQDQLVRAFAEIARDRTDALLMLVGSRGDYHADHARLVSDTLSIGERVRIEPTVPDARPYYAMADLLVSASDVESLPRSMLEAMALGLPIVSTAAFGVPELIQHGRSGWLSEPRDTRALVDALREALSLSPERRAEVASRARATVQAEHRSDRCSELWWRTIRDVVGIDTPANTAEGWASTTTRARTSADGDGRSPSG